MKYIWNINETNQFWGNIDSETLNMENSTAQLHFVSGKFVWCFYFSSIFTEASTFTDFVKASSRLLPHGLTERCENVKIQM